MGNLLLLLKIVMYLWWGRRKGRKYVVDVKKIMQRSKLNKKINRNKTGNWLLREKMLEKLKQLRNKII